MKRKLASGLILLLGTALAVTIFLFPQKTTLAASTCQSPSFELPVGSGQCWDPTGCDSGFAKPPGSTQCQDYRGLAGAGDNNGDNMVAGGFGCSIFSWGGLKGCAAALAYWVMNLAGVFLGIAGILLNGAIEITVQKMSSFVDDIKAIETTWTLIRDLGNIIILFVLLFSAIGTIFRNDVIVPKSTLVGVVIAAILINFSLFFTQAIIDVSNVATNTIYQEIRQISAAQSKGSDNPIELTGISGAFMKGLSPQTMYSQIQKSAGKSEDYESHIFQQMVFGTIVILIAAFVLLITALMLFIRFGILIMLLITSPLGVVGKLIPKLAGYSKQWWETLVGQAMFAPVLMLFILITISIINSPGFKTSVNLANQDFGPESGIGKFFSFLGAGTGSISLFIQYFLIIFFLIFGVVIAKKIAGGTGAGAIKWAEKTAGKFAYGVPRAIGGTAARAVVGGGAEAIGKRYDNLLAKIPTANYRSVDKYTLGLFGAADRATRQGIKGAEQVKFGTGRTLQDVRTAEKTRQRELGTIDEQKRRQGEIDAGTAHVEELFRNNDQNTFNSETDEVIKKYLDQVKKLSNEQLENMLQNNLDLLQKEHFAMALSQKQMDFIKESKLIRETDKDDIKNARERGLAMQIHLASDKWLEGARIASAKPADVANLPKALLKKPEVAAGLNIDALKQILSNATLGTADRNAIKTEIEKRHNDLEAKQIAQQAAGAALSSEESKQLANLRKSLGWLNHPDRQLEW